MSEKITAMIEEIKGLTVLELSELVHEIEDVFGVSAAAVSSFTASASAGASACSSCTVAVSSASFFVLSELLPPHPVSTDTDSIATATRSAVSLSLFFMCFLPSDRMA